MNEWEGIRQDCGETGGFCIRTMCHPKHFVCKAVLNSYFVGRRSESKNNKTPEQSYRKWSAPLLWTVVSSIAAVFILRKGTTLRVITNDFLSYVVNKKRYRISLFIFACAFVWFHKWMCYDFSSFIHWICECCVMFWRKVQWQNFDLCMWLLHEFWQDFEICCFFFKL
jgi:hypothetical protein